MKYSMEQAREAWLASSWVSRRCQTSGKEGIMEVMNRFQVVQVDPIETCGTNHDLTLFSRLENYRKKDLQDMLYRERTLIEATAKMYSIIPVERWPLLRSRHARLKKLWAPLFRANPEIVRQIESVLDDQGTVSSRDVKGRSTTEYGWKNRASMGNVVLQHMHACGDIIVHHRQGKIKHYCRPGAVLPSRIVAHEPMSETEARMEHAMMICRASRLVSPRGANEQWYHAGGGTVARRNLDLLEKEGRVFCPEIEGMGEKVYAPADDRSIWDGTVEDHRAVQRGEIKKGRVEMKGKAVKKGKKDQISPIPRRAIFLAPLDPVMWSRRLFNIVFGHDYRWEVYTPVARRKHGYYSLPVLKDNALVGLIEPVLEKTGKITVRGRWDLSGKMDNPETGRMMEEELERLEQMHSRD